MSRLSVLVERYKYASRLLDLALAERDFDWAAELSVEFNQVVAELDQVGAELMYGAVYGTNTDVSMMPTALSRQRPSAACPFCGAREGRCVQN